MKEVSCPYCNEAAHKKTGLHVYPHRKDLWDKIFYVCFRCEARVGCHGDSDRPLGRLANARDRKLKMIAHSLFDPLWRKGQMSRKEAYKWLANKMGLKQNECHFGMFDRHKLDTAIQILKSGDFS